MPTSFPAPVPHIRDVGVFAACPRFRVATTSAISCSDVARMLAPSARFLGFVGSYAGAVASGRARAVSRTAQWTIPLRAGRALPHSSRSRRASHPRPMHVCSLRGASSVPEAFTASTALASHRDDEPANVATAANACEPQLWQDGGSARPSGPDVGVVTDEYGQATVITENVGNGFTPIARRRTSSCRVRPSSSCRVRPSTSSRAQRA